MRNEKIRELAQQRKLEDIIRWTWHVLQMEPDKITRAAVNWTPPHGKETRPTSGLVTDEESSVESKLLS